MKKHLILGLVFCMTVMMVKSGAAEPPPSPNHNSAIGVNVYVPTYWGNDMIFVDIFRSSSRWIPHQLGENLYWNEGDIWNTGEYDKLGIG